MNEWPSEKWGLLCDHTKKLTMDNRGIYIQDGDCCWRHWLMYHHLRPDQWETNTIRVINWDGGPLPEMD